MKAVNVMKKCEEQWREGTESELTELAGVMDMHAALKIC